MTQGFVSFACQCWTVTYIMLAIFFFVDAQSAVLPLCKSEFKHTSCKGCVSCCSPIALWTLVYSLPEGLFFYLAEVPSSASWTGNKPHRPATCTGAPFINDSWFWGLLCPQQRECEQFDQKGLFLVLSLASLSASSLLTVPWCPDIHTKLTLLVCLSFNSACIFCKCCCCCPAIRADMYSSPIHDLRQKEFCAPQDCHLSKRHSREATHIGYPYGYPLVHTHPHQSGS